MKHLITITSFFLLVISVKATHNRAGEILYKRIAPYVTGVGSNTTAVYNYSITLIRYTDDGTTIADRCQDTIYFGDGTNGIAPRINGLTACSCGSLSGVAIPCGSVIVNTTNYKVKYNVYSITHTYASTGTFIISLYDPNRNQGVINIPNSVNIPFYVESMIVISSAIGINTSPNLLNPPIDQATLGACFYHNPGAIDAEGDSLSYDIIPCKSSVGQNAPGFSYPQTGAAGSFSINPVTGLLNWCTPQLLGEYNVAIVIKEWRKGTTGVYQLIGYVTRDMQILVKYGVVGISENQLKEYANIYPNPVTNMLTVDLGISDQEKVQSSLYSGDGRLVLQQVNEKYEGKLNFNMENLPKGIYFLRVQTSAGLVSRKIVKE